MKTETKVKHTKLPWYFSIPDKYEVNHGIEYEITNEPKGLGVWIVEVQSKTNAAFIVRACNSYYDLKEKNKVLLEAAKGMDEVIKSLLGEHASARHKTPTNWGVVNNGLIALTKAIAEAEKGG